MAGTAVIPAGGWARSAAEPIEVDAAAVAPRAGEAATRPADAIRGWVIDLAADDAAVRARARQALLNLSPRDLPALRSVVRTGAANLPAQREALYEIVVHLYLTGDRPPPAEPTQSFMGIELPRAPSDELGLVPQNRIIGFPAYASLLPGDIVLQIEERPSMDVSDQQALGEFRRLQQPGTTIHLRVLREGEVVRVPLTLAIAPNWGGDVKLATERRLERAETYWQTQFEPAFAEGTS